ncbi:AFL139Wp [Eremothecium gossypii ATCC 10895]|uniref:AFL139Wp n=1 Tax=Eremothecium gossypii (strain ATCC 10895 / CBS 109.51 / FGSC 9923 / NRRL Y-1056) TaxID=284811 RepID=Q755G2_EREGS|nr:AFL139Wp [Eremothecium gossypii ATCC 10895]AAS53235.1 AFL139Wp [Eremothecium gossypii ATCC 10895]AEY97545.1 FAFL139Wp [Eremothecium gossypii FDAG1]
MNQQNPYDSGNPYADAYEMQGYRNSGNGAGPAQSGAGGDDFVVFMNGIGQINNELDRYSQLIGQIDVYQKRLLTEVNEEQEIMLRKQLDVFASQASDLQYQLKDDIKRAQQQAAGDMSKEAQAENSRQRFLKLIQDYRITEANYRENNKEQAKRQYRIIQPEATDDEVEAAISDVGGQQIFSQALLSANRRGEAKTALAEVQARHQELLKLEKTMAELTQLFNDMEHLVIEQQEQVEFIDKQVEEAQQDVEQGVGHTNKAVKSARRARKNKIRCIIILIIVLIIVAIAVAVPLATRK